MDLAVLETLYKEYLNRPTITSVQIQFMLRATEGELNRLLKTHPRNLARVQLTHLADAVFLTLPLDLLQIRTLILDGVEWEQYPPTMREEVDLRGQFSPDEGGYIHRGDVLEIFPKSAEDRVFDLDYYQAIDALEDAADTNWILTYFSDVYLYGLLKESTVFLKNDARLALWEDQFYNRVTQLAAQGEEQNIATSPVSRYA